MKLKSIIALAALIVAGTAVAQNTPDKKCGAGSCSKKEVISKADKDASCSKKESSCSKKQTNSKVTKEAGCSKKEASCAKK